MTKEHNAIIWFEIPVTDLARAKDFYGHVLTIELEEQVMGELQLAFFPMQHNTSGASGTLVKGNDYTPSQNGTLVYFTTADIESALARAEERGGRTLKPKTAIGEYGFIGLLRDSEGNHIGLHSAS